MGRKTKLTPDLIKAFVELIKTGVPIKYICAMLRVGEKSFYNWMQRGEGAKKGIYLEFLQSIEAARGEFIKTALEGMKMVGYDDWRMWSWKLERLYRSEFGPNLQMDLDAKGEIKAKLEIENELVKKVISDEEATELAHKLLEKIADNKPGSSGV